MLHLLPIRLLLSLFAAMAGVAVIAAFYGGYVGTNDSVQAMLSVFRFASMLSLGAVIILYAAWRWIGPLQMYIFPYLGGTWEGEVRYKKITEDNGKEEVDASLEVKLEAKHTLFAIKLLLESDESTSTTLAVHAEKDPDFEKFRLYYVYLNRRNEGVAGGGDAYRGLAVVRWSNDGTPALEGSYFTETDRKGTLHLRRTMRTPFWKLWC